MSIIYPDDFIHQRISKWSKNKLTAKLNKTFHQNVKFFLTIGQLFAIAPIEGISSPKASSLKFKLFNWRMAYTVLIILTSFTMTAINFHWTTLLHFKFENVVPLIFFSSNTIVMCTFINIARKWPKLMYHWETFEMQTTIRDPKIHRTMRRYMQMASVGIPLLSLLEHLLSLANNVNTARSCKNTKDSMEAYFKQAFPAFYYFFAVHYWNGALLQLLTFFCTFTWNFTDNFIIIISLGLVEQFRHFNAHFERFNGMILPDRFWAEQRTYFNKLLKLLSHVNEDFAFIIVLSYSNNLFYICLQLFNSVASSDSIIRSIYVVWSLMFLIGRTLLVSITAARINDEAQRPIQVVQMIPEHSYHIEASRFMQQLTTSTIALSGMKFFYITRKFMLSVIATVVTYELVLIQLRNEQNADYDPCEGY